VPPLYPSCIEFYWGLRSELSQHGAKNDTKSRTGASKEWKWCSVLNAQSQTPGLRAEDLLFALMYVTPGQTLSDCLFTPAYAGL
jgi:hypothetical protein